jgi:hypothetical protein
LVTNSDRALGISASRSNRPIGVEFHGDVMSVTFGGSIAGPHEQAMQPRIEAIGITQPAQVLPSSDQGILNGVLRHLVVAQDEAGDTKQATRTARRQRRERIQVSLPSTNYEVALDRTTLRLGRRKPAFTTVWAVESRICSIFADGAVNGRIRANMHVLSGDGRCAWWVAALVGYGEGLLCGRQQVCEARDTGLRRDRETVGRSGPRGPRTGNRSVIKSSALWQTSTTRFAA